MNLPKFTVPKIASHASRPSAMTSLAATAWSLTSNDPTYAVFWTDAPANVLSITDVRAGSGTQQKDALGFTNLVENTLYGDDTWFVTDPATVVEIDKQPFTG